VIDDEIGDFTTVAESRARAPELLKELVRRQPPGGQPPRKVRGKEPNEGGGTTSTPGTTPPTGDEATTTGEEKTTTGEKTKTAPGPVEPSSTTDNAPPFETDPAKTKSKRPPYQSPTPAVAYGKECTCSVPRLTGVVGAEKGKKNAKPAKRPLLIPGQPVEVTGSGLGLRADLKLDGKPIDRRYIVRWSARSITFVVPPDAKSGILTVDCGVESNPLHIDVATRNVPPTAVIRSTLNDERKPTFRLDGRQSGDVDGAVARWRWQEGRRVHRGPTWTVTPQRERTTVELSVVDNDGGRDTARTTLRTGVEVQSLLADELFEFGEHKLSDKGKRSVDALKVELKRRQADVRELRIEGYADFVGEPRDNDKLSLQRAEAVRDRLLRGVKLPRGVKVTPQGFGESKKKATTLDDPRRAHDRRVDVRVVYRRLVPSRP
jgi:outer membrane protein OmpA-like peptidoglycan-associated protein